MWIFFIKMTTPCNFFNLFRSQKGKQVFNIVTTFSFKLPYFGKSSQCFCHQLSRTVFVKVSPVFSVSKVNRVFQHKDQTFFPCVQMLYRTFHACVPSTYCTLVWHHDIWSQGSRSTLIWEICKLKLLSIVPISNIGILYFKTLPNGYDVKINEAF